MRKRLVGTEHHNDKVYLELSPRTKWRIIGNRAGPWSLDPVVPPSGEEPQPRVVQ